MAEPIDVGDTTISVTTSIGIACAHGVDSRELLRHADEALYLAKSAGRNRWTIHPSCLPQHPSS